MFKENYQLILFIPDIFFECILHHKYPLENFVFNDSKLRNDMY